MSTPVLENSETTPPADQTHPSLKVTQARVMLSEWTKFWSLRSTQWTLLISAVLMVGIGAIYCAVTVHQWASTSPQDKATFNATTGSLNGIILTQMAIGVLGVLLMSGEYSTGMIRATLTVVPRRLPVLWAKLGIFAAAVLILSLITSLAAFFIGQGILSSQHLNVSLSAPGALRSVVGAALYLTVAGLMGLALGALFRNTAAGISAYVGAFFLLPTLAQLLPSSLRDHIVKFLPSNAGAALYGGGQGSTSLSPWVGFAVFCGYAAVLIVGAAVRLRRSDA